MAKTIDVTPTWDAIVKMYLQMWDAMNNEGKKTAREELIRCGKIAQTFVEVQKKFLKHVNFETLDSQIKAVRQHAENDSSLKDTLRMLEALKTLDED